MISARRRPQAITNRLAHPTSRVSGPSTPPKGSLPCRIDHPSTTPGSALRGHAPQPSQRGCFSALRWLPRSAGRIPRQRRRPPWHPPRPLTSRRRRRPQPRHPPPPIRHSRVRRHRAPPRPGRRRPSKRRHRQPRVLRPLLRSPGPHISMSHRSSHIPAGSRRCRALGYVSPTTKPAR